MITNRNIICISSIDWDFVWQGHQEIMSTFAKNGNRVLFIENTGVRVPRLKDTSRIRKRIFRWLKGARGFRKEMDNLFIYSPVSLPFPYSRLANWINKQILIKPLKNWMRITRFHNPIIWTFLPTRTALGIADAIEHELLVYYCIADFSKLADSPKKVSRTETELIKRSDLVFVQGEDLKKKCNGLNDNVHIFPFGVRMKIFDDFRNNNAQSLPELDGLSKPIIGYVGGIHKHIDFDLLIDMAKTHSDWSIVLVGPEQEDVSRIKNFANIYLLGKKDFSELPKYINKFDVCLIPYLKTDYTLTVYPTKLNEYLALGKPVVSTDLPEINKFNHENGDLVYIADNRKNFIKKVGLALAENNKELMAKRIDCAAKNDWPNRIELMSGQIENTIREKYALQLNWRDNFLKFYRFARRKAISLILVSAGVYLVIFYTPLIWLLASPLKISQAPKKADAIVTFAGGVGESGKAGQGYEERVQYAVDLFKKKYAGHLIFSSGYKYVFEETAIMKSLALSLGVPPDAIIIEDRARNTFENVKFTTDILNSRNWDKILLVSSPYHMRRLSLVYKKIAPDIEVNYTPLPKSIFYSRPALDEHGKRDWKKISIKQIKGIIHEYLGIIYYWLKGAA